MMEGFGDGPFGEWPFGEAPVTLTTPVPARPPRIKRYQPVTVQLKRQKPTVVLLPRRMNANPIPQGSSGVLSDEVFHYGEGYYDDMWYTE